MFLVETHLYAFQHKHVGELRAILSDYVLFFSSIDLPPSAASLVRLHRSSAAPGGTLVAVHKSIVSDPRVKSVVPSAQLKGYVSHVRVPLFSGHYLHLVGAYCPPSNRTLHSDVHTNLSTLATSPQNQMILSLLLGIGTPLFVYLQTPHLPLIPLSPSFFWIRACPLCLNCLALPLPFPPFLVTLPRCS